MRSRVTVRGQPVHPMLVKFPIGLYSAGFAALLAFIAVGDAFWYRAAYVSMLAGVAVAAIAIPIGMLDLAQHPRDTPAKRTGFAHGGAAVASTIFFAGAGLSLRGEWIGGAAPGILPYGIPLTFAIVGFGLLMLAGILGARLVSVHHAGVSPVPGTRDHVELARPLTHAPRPRPSPEGVHP